jgi:ABC-type transporter Mla subunit MlaD
MIVGRVRRPLTVLTVALVALTGCVGPSRTDGDYHRKASNSAEAMRSAVESGRLVADLALKDRAFGNYLNVAAGEAEQAADGVVQAFDSVQPPSTRADAVREQFDALFQTATGALGDLRIAIRRHRLEDVKKAAADLAAVSAKLEPLVGV